ncbi:TetR/AcrR family transcriptional regulator [Frankia tisae]|uniref:TetR/AcrR family transcriptional regulator n=1 Tax=Frankia tisae TaxID=2950104 RepID=UPI0021C18BA1|nr:TetR/AcrR family transcriptional regulator [Frankia tisae]
MKDETSTVKNTTAPRRRDAAASKERLLAAAAHLFAERGFDKTTARDIGQLAGIDPTMIARYFGGKAQLYIAVLQAEDAGETPTDFLEPDRLAALVRRTDRSGPGPIFQAALKPYDDQTAQQAAAAELHRRIVAPLTARLAREHAADAHLRAELLTAALIGVVLARHTGVLATLAGADTDTVIALLEQALDQR